MILLYALLVSSGFGFEPGYGAGAALDTRYVWLEGYALAQDKITAPARRYGALATLRYGQPWFGEVGWSWRRTDAERWTKDGHSPVLGVGHRVSRWRALLRYFPTDNTVNELQGFRAQWEWMSRPYLRAAVSWFEFDDTNDWSATVGAGWRF